MDIDELRCFKKTTNLLSMLSWILCTHKRKSIETLTDKLTEANEKLKPLAV
jgi:hypothetical protein